MVNDVTLSVYTPVSGTPAFIEDIAPYAIDYTHTTRLRGGYWTATWKMDKDAMGESWYDQWKTNRYFYHLVESYQGQTTWEGSIEGFEPDDSDGLLTVTAYGYVHSLQNQFNSTTDTGTTDANEWIHLMIDTDAQYVTPGYLQANTLQCYKAGTDKIWTEILKVVELGDGSTYKPWKVGVYNDRLLYYEAVSTTPIGYVRGGIRWRVDMPNDLINYCYVRYTDETGAAQPDVTASLTESVNLYGTREERLERSNLPTASATALASQYVYEHMWPYTRAVGCGRDIQVYDSVGCNNAVSPWLVLPGVFCDTTRMGGNGFYLGWLGDVSYFLADEIVANEKGVQLRTSKWSEADQMEAYYDYINDAPKERKKKKKKK